MPIAAMFLAAALIPAARAAEPEPAPAAAPMASEAALPRDSARSAAPMAGVEVVVDDLDDFNGFDEEFAPAKPVRDPLGGWNRAVFHFNDKFYFWLAKPAARGYGFVVPKPLRTAIDRGFNNMRYPVRLVGCLMQAKLKRAGGETRRFLVNSTLGVGGLFDPAARWFRWKRPPEEDLGQALGAWGLGPGFPLGIPFLGQNNLRDGLMLFPAVYLSPVPWITDVPTSFGVGAGEQLNYVSLHIGEYESLKKDALDPYAFIRDAQLRSREKKIKE
ncbi:MAG: VacJ family lipoprotein [Elusimicrobia bacterium]|nr:VacJ family lipoprotein [Elusimicrobiota bacterium]